MPRVRVRESVGRESKITEIAFTALEPIYRDWTDRLIFAYLQHDVVTVVFVFNTFSYVIVDPKIF